MLSLIFEMTNGESVMLPLDKTAFREIKMGAESYTVAYFGGERFDLKATMAQVTHAANGAIMQAQGPAIMPPNLRFK